MVVVAGAVAALAGWASGWALSTWGARTGTFGSALAVLALGAWSAHRSAHRTARTAPAGSPPPARRPLGWGWLWVATVVVAATWDVLALLTPPDRHHLTLSALELAERPLHALVFALWLLIGWVLASTPMRARARAHRAARAER